MDAEERTAEEQFVIRDERNDPAAVREGGRLLRDQLRQTMVRPQRRSR